MRQGGNEAAEQQGNALSRWLELLHERHVAPYRTQEFTRALRALSARYVERRSELPGRSPLDSAGKRSAFAAYYAPIHFFTIREILRALPADATPPRKIIDLGCGSGVAGAAWAMQDRHQAAIVGVDENAWALDEANWNWKALGLTGRTAKANFVDFAARPAPAGFILAWSVNELPRDARDRLLPALVSHARAGSPILVVEPLARGAAPWWDDWARRFTEIGGRADEWKFKVELPEMLRRLGHAAGLQIDKLSARSISNSQLLK